MTKEEASLNSQHLPREFVHEYDAHVYYLPHQSDLATRLRERALQDFAGQPIFVGRLIPRPVGPHPLPMFEIDFSKKDFPRLLQWLREQRGALTVLVHTVTGNDFHDHFEGATWLGEPLPLDTSKLDPNPA